MSGSRGRDEFQSNAKPQPQPQPQLPVGNIDPEILPIKSGIDALFMRFQNLVGLSRQDVRPLTSVMSGATDIQGITKLLEEEKTRVEGLSHSEKPDWRADLFRKYSAFLAHQLERLPELVALTRFSNGGSSQDTTPAAQKFRIKKIELLTVIDIAIQSKNKDFVPVDERDEKNNIAFYNELREKVKAAADPQALLAAIKSFKFYENLGNFGIVKPLVEEIEKLQKSYAESEQKQFVKPSIGFDKVKNEILSALSNSIADTKDPRIINIKQAIKKAKSAEEVWPILEFQIALYDQVKEPQEAEEKINLAVAFGEFIKNIADVYKTAGKDNQITVAAYELFKSCQGKIDSWLARSTFLAESPTPAPSSSRSGLFGTKSSAPKELSFQEIKQLILKQLPKPKFNPPKAERELMEAITDRIQTFDDLKNILELGEWLYENPGQKPSIKEFPSVGFIERYDNDRSPLGEPSRELYQQLNTCLQLLGKYTSSPINANSFRPG